MFQHDAVQNFELLIEKAMLFGLLLGRIIQSTHLPPKNIWRPKVYSFSYVFESLIFTNQFDNCLIGVLQG